MRKFLRRAFNLDLVDGLLALTRQQQALLEKTDLQHARNTRDLVQQFLLAVEHGVEPDILRADLTAGLCDLSDHVARLEEHVS